MSVLITADLHLSDNPRDEYRHAFMKDFVRIVKRRKAEAVLILGDLTEEKDRHPARLVNRVAEYVAQIAALCPVVIDRGNHDYIDIAHPFYAFLGRISGVAWVNAPTTAQNVPLPLPATLKRALFLPHTTDFERDWSGLSFGAHDFIFAHNTFTGATPGHGRKLRGISTDVFPAKVRVVSGDIHVPQDVGPVKYVGAPYTVDFGDDYEPRMLSLANGKLEHIPCDGYAQKVLVEVASIAELEAGKSYDLREGDILKVRYHLSAEDHDRWYAIKAQIREWAEQHKYVLDHVQPRTMQQRKLKRGPDRTNVKSDTQLLRSYARARRVDDGMLEAGLAFVENKS